MRPAGDNSALWYDARGGCSLRAEPAPVPAPGEVLVRTLYSGVSRGTERLVLTGAVPEAEAGRMRCPFQKGDFAGPVKYGYQAVGRVEHGPQDLIGRAVFALHPHQTLFAVPAEAVLPLPEGLPPRRAAIAANVETALNALWDGGAAPADRITIVGGGMIGLLTGWLAARLPGAAVTLVDIAPERAGLAERLGLRFLPPGAVQPDADLVFHASASAAGLATAIAAAAFEARIVEMSWYGAGSVAAPLGGAFHSRRLSLVSSQVGHVPAARRARWSRERRLVAALALMDDARLDALIGCELPITEAPARLPALLAGGGAAPGIVLSHQPREESA